MTEVRPLIDSAGGQYYPQTKAKAIKDLSENIHYKLHLIDFSDDDTGEISADTLIQLDISEHKKLELTNSSEFPVTRIYCLITAAGGQISLTGDVESDVKLTQVGRIYEFIAIEDGSFYRTGSDYN